MEIAPNRRNAAERRYLELAREFGPGGRDISSFKVMRGRKTHTPSIGLTNFHNAMVLPGEWLVVAGDRVLCDFFVQTPSPPMTAYMMEFDFGSDTIELIHEQPRALPVDTAFLLGGCRNYSHWLLDYLPRLALCGDPSVPLLVNGPLTAFQLESLRILGVGEDRLLPLEYPSSVSVRHLLYPSLCSSSFTPPHSFRPGVLAWLRESFAPLMRSERRERKIFISRGGEIDRHRRRLLNHEEIAGIAQKHDFDIVSPEKLSFIDQIKLFAGASVIAGAHGAGFANMIFAPKGTSLVELIGPRLSDSEWSMGYVRLAALAGQSVTRIVGQSDEREAIAFDHLPYETYTIDPKEFATVLDG